MVGLATAARLAGDGTRPDLSIVIEDAWQHHGLAQLLLGALFERAWERGVRRLSFQVTSGQSWLLGWAGRYLRSIRTEIDTEVILVEATLSPPE